MFVISKDSRFVLKRTGMSFIIIHGTGFRLEFQLKRLVLIIKGSIKS